MTVRGPIDPSRLGITLTHEHLFSDISKFLLPTYNTPASEMALWEENQELTLENLHVAMDLFKPLREIAVYSDETLAIAEANYYRDAGGNTIVDVTSKGIRPDPLALRRVSYATGLNVVMGSGWYVKDYHPDDMDRRTVGDLADEIVRDITVGVNGTPVRSGIIGEVGIDGDPITPNEVKSIRAVARASKATGAAISFHRSGVGHDEKLEVLDTVVDEGGDLSRTILGHSDFIAMELPLMKELLAMGPYIEFDLLGNLDAPLYHRPSTPARMARTPNSWSVDTVVAEAILGLIEAGYEDRVLLSHDQYPRQNLRSYGGSGWAFILEKFLPHLRTLGVTEEQINKFTVENPKRVLTFVAPG